nr:uncharacterized protein LOC111127051 isoform X2 [Crassostrea virginica]
MAQHKLQCTNGKLGGRQCVAWGCGGTKYGFEKLSFHYFPFDRPAILRQWVRFVKQTRKDWKGPKKYSALCSLHFTVDSYPAKYKILESLGEKITRRELLKDAVPTIHRKAASLHEQPEFADSEWSSPLCPAPKKPRRAFLKREAQRIVREYEEKNNLVQAKQLSLLDVTPPSVNSALGSPHVDFNEQEEIQQNETEHVLEQSLQPSLYSTVQPSCVDLAVELPHIKQENQDNEIQHDEIEHNLEQTLQPSLCSDVISPCVDSALKLPHIKQEYQDNEEIQHDEAQHAFKQSQQLILSDVQPTLSDSPLELPHINLKVENQEDEEVVCKPTTLKETITVESQLSLQKPVTRSKHTQTKLKRCNKKKQVKVRVVQVRDVGVGCNLLNAPSLNMQILYPVDDSH